MAYALTADSTSPANPGLYARKAEQSSSSSSGIYKRSPADFIGSFYAVLRRWESETAFLSDPDAITNHPSYRALVAHAKLVLPLILNELRLSPSPLVWVLEESLGASPYLPQDVGDIPAMAEAWIAWGERSGYIR